MSTSLSLNPPVKASRFTCHALHMAEDIAMSEKINKTELKQQESLVKSFGQYMGKLATARQQMGRIFLDLAKQVGQNRAVQILANAHGFAFEKTVGRKLNLDTLKLLAGEYQDLSANGGFAHGIHVVTGADFDTLNLSVSDSEDVRTAVKSGLVKVSDLKRYVKLAGTDPKQAHDNLLQFVTHARVKALAPKIELSASEKLQAQIEKLQAQIADKRSKAEKLIDESTELEKQVIALQADLLGMSEDTVASESVTPVTDPISSEPELEKPLPAKLQPRKRSSKVTVNDATYSLNGQPVTQAEYFASLDATIQASQQAGVPATL